MLWKCGWRKSNGKINKTLQKALRAVCKFRDAINVSEEDYGGSYELESINQYYRRHLPSIATTIHRLSLVAKKQKTWSEFPSFILWSYETQYVHAYNQSTTVKQNNVFSRERRKRKSEMLLNSALLIIVCIKFTRQPPPNTSNPFPSCRSRYTFLTVMRYDMRKSTSWWFFDVRNMLKLMFEF